MNGSSPKVARVLGNMFRVSIFGKVFIVSICGEKGLAVECLANGRVFRLPFYALVMMAIASGIADKAGALVGRREGGGL